jgi:hypothetical protein
MRMATRAFSGRATQVAHSEPEEEQRAKKATRKKAVKKAQPKSEVEEPTTES